MPSNYKDTKLIIKRLRQLHGEGKIKFTFSAVALLPAPKGRTLSISRGTNGRPKTWQAFSRYKDILQINVTTTEDFGNQGSGPENIETYIRRRIKEPIKISRKIIAEMLKHDFKTNE